MGVLQIALDLDLAVRVSYATSVDSNALGRLICKPVENFFRLRIEHYKYRPLPIIVRVNVAWTCLAGNPS